MNYIQPQWPAPKNVHAYTTTREHGNLKDDHSRALLKEHLKLPSEPKWLTQTHSDIIISAEEVIINQTIADASYTQQPNTICVVLTADCLPILICNRKGTLVSAIHAGWKGLAGGIVEATINKLPEKPEELLVWLGPGIGASAYEVGDDFRDAFMQTSPEAAKAFVHKPNNKWLANMYLLAQQRLHALGISPDAIFGANYCTYLDIEHFYSYRREKQTGRMASLIWLSK